ncbi:MAG: ATP-binding cassette domain-containing protein [Chloroflexi bacterium]|nr:ATP-binding cassette domain-containing protein [Chloroflexota bacterium]
MHALDSVSLKLETGERRGVIGPNGAGKTTLFHLISGMLQPTAGRIHLFGHDVTRMPTHRRTGLGLACTFQITNLFAKLTLKKNLLLSLQGLDAMKFSMLRSMSSYTRLQAKADELLEEWELLDRSGLPVWELSYGDQRKVEILLAMAQNPKLLLLDEPTAGLSPAETAVVCGLIRKLPRRTTILLIEHDMDVAFDLVDNISVLHVGKVAAQGTCQEIRNNAIVQDIYLGKSKEEAPYAL